MSQTTNTITVIRLGHGSIPLDLEGLSDTEVLEVAAKAYPQGFNVIGNGNQGVTWIHPDYISEMAAGDGVELTGLARAGSELVRLAADPERTEALGAKMVNLLLARFRAAAAERATAQKPQQLHSVRFGATAKVVVADRVEWGVLEIHPDGSLARQLCKSFGIKWDDRDNLEDLHVVAVRHPFILAGVQTIVFNTNLTRSLGLVNRLWLRTLNLGDSDGDALAWMPIADGDLARELREQLDDAVPDGDATLLARGICTVDAECERWGENIFTDGKTAKKKLTQAFAKTPDEWLLTHARMGELANKFTPFAYRISDICALMAAVGVPGSREASLFGAVVEEDFYLGLSGGPKVLDNALEAWMRAKSMPKTVKQVILAGLREVAAPGLITGDVAIALLEGARLNQGLIDNGDPCELVVRVGWLIGKGRIAGDEGSDLLRDLQGLCADPNVPTGLRDNAVGQLAFYAARKLTQVLGFTAPDDGDDNDPWAGLEDPWANDMVETPDDKVDGYTGY
jgi:hypothetical protein